MSEVVVRTQDPALRDRLRPFLAAQGCEVAARSAWGERVSDVVRDPQTLALVIIDWSAAPNDPGVAFVRDARQHWPRLPILVLARDRSEDLAIEALHLRVDSYLKHPVAFDDLASAILQNLTPVQPPALPPPPAEAALVGETAPMRALKEYMRNVAASDSNVLISGETGTGKEMVAQYIHRASRRRNKPFICINCAAIPESLVESELFGYERGAFTGAVAARSGRLQQANGGTVFFDEIGDMSRLAQAKILRAIETKEIYPLGGQRRVSLDVRVIAATNRDLEAMVRDDSFRSDLYFRLRVVLLMLPPLRDRRSDIPLLVRHWLPSLNATFGRHVTAVDGGVLRRLMSHSWPGNVRELKNVLEISFLNLPPDATTIVDLHEVLDGLPCTPEGVRGDDREHLLSALVATRWNISEAARRLRWSRMTIYRRLAKYDLPLARPVTDKARVVTPGDSYLKQRL